MEAIQLINGTEFRYDVIKQVGMLAGKKIFQLKNKDTGFICNMFEDEFKIL